MEKDLGKTILEQMPYDIPKDKRSVSPWAISLLILTMLTFGIFYYYKKVELKKVIPAPSQLLGNTDNGLNNLDEIEKDLAIPELSKGF